jgi:hypothetical protein
MIDKVLICGYYDEDNGKDYIAEVDSDKLKKWFEEEKLDLLDFETNIEKKIAVYNILEKELTKHLAQYQNFTVIFR